MTVANAPVLVKGDADATARRHPLTGSGLLKFVGLTPFAVYVLLFLAIPTVLAVTTGFFDAEGGFTLTLGPLGQVHVARPDGTTLPECAHGQQVLPAGSSEF